MRYFIIFYTGQVTMSAITYGSVTRNQDSYPNKNEVQNSIKKELNAYTIILTNIIELNEKDFNDLIK